MERLQLVSRESKYFFDLLTRREYAISRDDGVFKDFQFHAYQLKKFWWDEGGKFFDDCWTTNFKKANDVYQRLTGFKPKYEYFVIEESDYENDSN